MILALVLLPAFSSVLGGEEAAVETAASGPFVFFQPDTVIGALGLTLAKLAAFLALMILVGRRVIPWILHYIAHTGSRELFRLAVLAIALGVAFGASELFGVSFALGAFFAGMILAESQLSQSAAQETLPLRDAFAVLFFVSVGMLFDPTIARAPALPGRGDAADHPGRQCRRGLRHRPPVRPFVPGASRSASRCRRSANSPSSWPGLGIDAGAAARDRARPHPGRRHGVDPGESAAVRRAERLLPRWLKTREGGAPAEEAGEDEVAELPQPPSRTTRCWSAMAASAAWWRRP